MKLRNLMWGACACIFAAGCSNDDVVVDKGNTVESTGNAYMKVRIAMTGNPSSRATSGDYDYGTTEEQSINNVFFMFYDDEGNWVADGKQQETVIVNPSEGENNPVEAIAEAVLALELKEGEEFPTQVVAYVNMKDEQANLSGKSITEVKEEVANSVCTAAEGKYSNFVMTNSTYLKDGVEKIGTDVARDQFFEKEDAAKEADPVEIYVERLAAKVTVLNSTPTISDIEAGDYTLTFVPEGYAISGLNTSEYYLKHIQTGWSSWSWFNAPTDFRCFWAEDPNYDKNATITYTNYNESKVALGTAQYCMENTMTADYANFNNSTFLILVGYYVVKDSEGNTVDLAVNSDGYLYMYAGTAYMAEDLKERLLEQAADNELAWVTTDGGKTYTQADASAYEIVRKGTNTVTLALKENTGTTYYTQQAEDTYTEITNIATFNEELSTYLEYFGSVEAFENGKASYAKLIEHFGGTQANDMTGAIGVVRNHSYQITVTQVSGLGEGVFNPAEDIIPTDTEKTYYVGAEMNILSWKTVSQTVSFD